jgi:glutaredoxin
MTAEIVLYTARGCHLCDSARETLDTLRAELGFHFDEVDITGSAELEERYRELLPVVEIDGRRAFAYFVPPDAFRRALATAQSRPRDPRL